MDLKAGRGATRRSVARGVYWQSGEMTVTVQGEHGFETHTLPEWHYHLLDEEGYVLGHGDHYFDVPGEAEPGDHVRMALAGLLEDYGVTFDEGEPGTVYPDDARQGKSSRSGRPHCPSCGAKLESRSASKPTWASEQCPACGYDLLDLDPPDGVHGAAIIAGTTSLMTLMLHAIGAWALMMLASLSNYAEDGIANAIGNNAAFQIAQSYTKLHTGDPGEDGTNNAAGETTRKSTSYGASSGGVITTDADLTWTNVSTTETYSHVSKWDASSAGNCLGSGALTASKSVTAADTFTIPSGSQTVTIT